MTLTSEWIHVILIMIVYLFVSIINNEYNFIIFLVLLSSRLGEQICSALTWGLQNKSADISQLEILDE